MKRVDGQIWIDKTAPYRLKYHINGVDYVVQVAASYTLITDANEDALPTGTVVKYSTEQNAVEPAVFPEDINRVLGVMLNSLTNSNSDEIAVTQSGYLIIDADEIANAFPYEGDLNVQTNGWLDEDGGVGAPVYWFIGALAEDCTYTDSDEEVSGKHPYRGRLTFRTPSGYKYNRKAFEEEDTSLYPAPYDDSFNVGYDNLPIIGTVVSYDLSGDEITSVYINVNFSTFDSSLEWTWPGLHYSSGSHECGTAPVTSGDTQRDLTIRHGLFADTPNNMQVANNLNIIANDDGESGSKYVIQTAHQDYYDDSDRRTVVELNTPEELYYRITGEVRYSFDRNHS